MADSDRNAQGKQRERGMAWLCGGRFTASKIGEQSVITGGCQQEELDPNSIEQLYQAALFHKHITWKKSTCLAVPCYRFIQELMSAN